MFYNSKILYNVGIVFAQMYQLSLIFSSLQQKSANVKLFGDDQFLCKGVGCIKQHV